VLCVFAFQGAATCQKFFTPADVVILLKWVFGSSGLVQPGGLLKEQPFLF
jgi:hypothetical protein